MKKGATRIEPLKISYLEWLLLGASVCLIVAITIIPLYQFFFVNESLVSFDEFRKPNTSQDPSSLLELRSILLGKKNPSTHLQVNGINLVELLAATPKGPSELGVDSPTTTDNPTTQPKKGGGGGGGGGGSGGGEISTSPSPPSSPPIICGNGSVEAGEQCDSNPSVCGVGFSCQNCACVPLCGNGEINSPETCDSGAQNGLVCVPPYGGNCTYCSTSCQSQTLMGPFCGDGLLNGVESCDGINLNNGSCLSLGFSTGTLVCTSTCQFDTSACDFPQPDTTPPEIPQLFQASPQNGHILLSWGPNAETDVHGYRIYRAIVENGSPKPMQFLSTVNAGTTSYLDSSVVNGVSYQYSLTAFDISGNEGWPSALQTKPSAVTFGSMQLVYDAGTPPFNAPNGCGTLDVPDTAADAFRDADGKIHLYSVFYNSRRMAGSSFSLLRRDCFTTAYPNTPPWMSSMSGVLHPTGWDSDYTKFNDEEWLSTPYYLGKVGSEEHVYMLVHNEFHPEAHDAVYPSCPDAATCQTYYSVTSAYSIDGGKTYTQNSSPSAYRVATLPDTFIFNPTSEPIGYGGHSNLIEKDGYMYSMVHVIDDPYITGKQMLCLIRTPLPLTKDSVWKGYSGNGQFNADLRGTDSCTPINNPDIATMHTSLTYNTFFGKYMLVGTHGQWVDMGNPGGAQLMTGIYYSLSDDLINWEKATLIAFAKMPWTNLDAPGVETLPHPAVFYPSIIDHDSTDPNFNTADQTAYLYITVGNPGVVTHQLVRYPITFLPKN